MEKYRNEEHYLGNKGYGFCGFGELAMHKGRQVSPKLQNNLVAMQDAKNVEYLQHRAELRKEYRDRLEKGEIEEYTIIESLIIQANGHPDLDATQAAKRCLQKRAIKY